MATPSPTGLPRGGGGWRGRCALGLPGLAALLILALLLGLFGTLLYAGWASLSWRFLLSGVGPHTLDPRDAGLLPMIVGTTLRVLLMSLFAMPAGVVTAFYLTEYARPTALSTRVIRGAVNNLAGVPSIVFGLFGLGFFVQYVGHGMDALLRPGEPSPWWGRDGLLWASLTLAVMTLPVVIAATEDALRGVPANLREASLALGATRGQTLLRIVLPEALPGILTGGILAVARAAGEVAPILFTGAVATAAHLPQALTDRFMDLGYHTFVLSTQGGPLERTRPVLCATVLVLLLLTLALNGVALLIRARLRHRRPAAF